MVSMSCIGTKVRAIKSMKVSHCTDSTCASFLSEMQSAIPSSKLMRKPLLLIFKPVMERKLFEEDDGV